MAKSPTEIKEDMNLAPAMPEVNKYPYGLCISLDNDSLEKLGLDCDCEVGDLLHGAFMAEVTSVSKHDSVNRDEPEHRVELQIKMLSVESEDDEEDEEDMRPSREAYKNMYNEDGE